MNYYPSVYSEHETLRLLVESGMSCARYGDGELRLALGGHAVSQKADKKLRSELLALLAEQKPAALVCIPNIYPRGQVLSAEKQESWRRYAQPRYTDLYRNRESWYGSSFITRPDSAPWIDNPEYWSTVKKLWRNKSVTLVIGSERSITYSMLFGESDRTRVVYGTYHDSYSEIDRIEKEVGSPVKGEVVILCIGATATVLAERLARKGHQALDLGHVGMFMRSEKRKPMMAALETDDKYTEGHPCQ